MKVDSSYYLDSFRENYIPHPHLNSNHAASSTKLINYYEEV